MINGLHAKSIPIPTQKWLWIKSNENQSDGVFWLCIPFWASSKLASVANIRVHLLLIRFESNNASGRSEKRCASPLWSLYSTSQQDASVVRRQGDKKSWLVRFAFGLVSIYGNVDGCLRIRHWNLLSPAILVQCASWMDILIARIIRSKLNSD